jgi:ferredoxin-NADP reductase
MMKAIDKLLNKVTMYRLVVYELVLLLVAAVVLGIFRILPYAPLNIVFSAAFIFCVSWIINKIFAWAFDVPTNPESTWITALILALIITPASGIFDMHFLPLAFWASGCAIASKYILAIHGKHIFNPAALGVAITGFVLGLSATWWVGTPSMIPFVLIGGLFIVRKIHRFDLWWVFIAVFTIGIAYFTLDHNLDFTRSFTQSFLYAPVFFFATVMLTEPATAPSTRWWRMLYSAGIAVLFLPNVSVGSFYFTPELALLVGNIGTYIVSPKYKLRLRLKSVSHLSSDTGEFTFESDKRISYKPGQYMEWTLAHLNADSRSVRRYFTLASSPTEKDIKIGVKFYAPASSFKQKLSSMKAGELILAAQLAGDFTMPRNKNKKLVFIAGGIGATPFRSMVQYMLDKREKRDVTILYSNRIPADTAYKDIFDRAKAELGIKTVYAFTDKNLVLPPGSLASIDAAAIAQEVPDYEERTFYLSGPQGMVHAFKDMLISMGVGRSNIKTDYFPGFA